MAEEQGDAGHRDLMAPQRFADLSVRDVRLPLQVNAVQEAVGRQGQVAQMVPPIGLQLALAHEVFEVQGHLEGR